MNHFNMSEQDLIDEAAFNKAVANVKNKGGGLDIDDSLDDLLEDSFLVAPVDNTNVTVHATTTPVVNQPEFEKPYSFPVISVDANQPDAGNLVKRLSELVAAWREHRDYLLIRDEYCGLAIALNIEGLLAPNFRPMPKNPIKKSEWTPVNLLIHQDRLVIECHWLYCRHEYVDTSDNAIDYQDLFDETLPFSFELAAAFASRNWAKKFRVDEAFALTNKQRCQLFALQGEVVYARHKAAKEGVGRGVNRVPPREIKLRNALGKWRENDKRIIPHLQSYKDLWLARELLDGGASIRQIKELAGYISGTKPKDNKTVSSNLKRLDNYLLKVT